MATHKGLRSITLTIGGTAQTAKLVSATPLQGASVEVDKIAAYGDTHYTSVPRKVKSWDEFTFTLLDEDGSNPVLAQVGDVATIAIGQSYGSGDGADSAGSGVSCKMVIQHVGPGGEVNIDGEQRSTVVITAVPHTEPAATTSND